MGNLTSDDEAAEGLLPAHTGTANTDTVHSDTAHPESRVSSSHSMSYMFRDDSHLKNTVDQRVEELLGGAPTLSIEDLAREAGVSVEEAQRFWRAMGFPNAVPHELIFGPADVRALQRESRMVSSQELDEVASLSLTRALSHMTDRLVLWQQEALVEKLSRGFDLDPTTARFLLIDRISHFVDHLQAQLDYAYRRQLAALIKRTNHELANQPIRRKLGEVPLSRAVGFVDMVAYTRRSKELGAMQLADLVQSFEITCHNVITSHGARIVKTIGDAVLYVADDLVTGANMVSDLVDAIKRDEKMLPVRASIVWGGLISRSGDIFGPVVNLASRLVDIAPVGTVLTDEKTAALLAGKENSPTYEMEALEPAELQGVGEVQPIVLGKRSF